MIGENFNYPLLTVGRLEKGRPTVLLLAGSMTSPAVFSQIESNGIFQMAAVDYCKSAPPWDVTSLGKRGSSLFRVGKDLDCDQTQLLT